MNIPRYVCRENTKNDFIMFLKEANEAKSDIYCNFEMYEHMKSLLPLSKEIKQDLKNYIESVNVCIDITQSDEETEHNPKALTNKDNDPVLDEINSILSDSLQTFEETNINDITDFIRDSLCMQNAVSDTIIKDLSNLGNIKLDKIFSSLAEQLSLEDVGNFWNSLIGPSINNEYVILCYVRFLFLPRVKQEFTYKLEAVFLSVSQKYATIIKTELVKEFSNIDLLEIGTNEVLQQYAGTLKNNFKTDVLRDFIYTCDRIHSNHISIIETLLNPQTDYDILGKIIEIMLNSVTEFADDNTYGKLLFNVVNLLDRNVCRLEQPLKHILGIHRSIWKIKVQKVVVAWFDDSLSQSFV